MSAPRRTSRLAVGLCTAVLVAACAKKERGTTDSAAGAVSATNAPVATPAGPSTPPAAPAIAIADVAGTWTAVAIPTAGDTTPTKFTLVIAAPNSFKETFANGQVVTAKGVLAGDSVVTDAGPFASVRRKGLKVVTHSVMRKEGDKLVGTTTAHYQGVKTADSVVTLRTEATRKR